MMYLICRRNICKNYVKCFIENLMVKCYCLLGFIGKFCDKGKICFFKKKFMFVVKLDNLI